jgi:hypothetical protein
MNNYGKDNITYSQIVFKQIQKIQDISARELRDSTKTVKNLIGEQIIEAEDTRYSYLQSVELLGSLLSPYFGNKIDEESINKKFEDFCKFSDMELITAIEDKEYIVELKKHFNFEKVEEIKPDTPLQVGINIYFLNDKIKMARKIFRDLVKLFKENDFLGLESYGEGAENTQASLDAIDEELPDSAEEDIGEISE